MPINPSMTANTFTPREMEVLALAWQCMETQPKINYAKLGELAGYTQASASVTFGNIKRKLKALSDSATAGGGAGVATPRKGTKSGTATPKSTGKKRGAKDIDGVGGGVEGTPTKKRGKVNRDEEDEEEEEIGAGFRVKKEEAQGLLEGMSGFLDNY